MFHLILPNSYPLLEAAECKLPLFYLMGPIAGGDDWQATMAEMLYTKVGECIIVNPSRYTEYHRHYGYRMNGRQDFFQDQSRWERYYLAQAGANERKGCIVGWLPCESATNPRSDGMPYAMDTRGEIGEWRAHQFYNPNVRLVIGAEADFPGLSKIQRDFDDMSNGTFEICTTMIQVLERAARFT